MSSNNPTTGPTGAAGWKEKYLSALEQQEQRDRRQLQQMTLLAKTVSRLSFTAEGIDAQFDEQLQAMRQLFRDGSPSVLDLNRVVSALEGQVKRLDTIKIARGEMTEAAFKSLAQQLKELKPESAARQKLHRFSKHLRRRSSLIQEYAALLNEYASLQQEVLLQSSTKPSQRPPFWQGWFAKSTGTTPVVSAPTQMEEEGQQIASAPPSPVNNVELEATGDGLDLADDGAAPRSASINPAAAEEEPPFSRLNLAICKVLEELLAQIEPPPMARENYKAARSQIANGLNWYELVPTLEEISIVVLSAFHNYQQEFGRYLGQINQRLLEADQFISRTTQAQSESIAANKLLDKSMREQMGSMQQSVADATELDQLKTEVSGRLDQILAAMDKHQVGEKVREASLSEQMDALVSRVKLMEADSATAEQRIEEQRQKALRDVLTQLPNRGGYQLRLEQEFERWQRYGRPLSLMVCDVDHFKKINDGYGHLAGDKVLRIIARSLAKRLRKTDFIARIGGEEFVVLMPETEREQAFKVAEGVRLAIANCPFHFKEERVSITMSFGLCEFTSGDQAEQVFARADKALYQAKEGGRNRCVLASLPPAATT